MKAYFYTQPLNRIMRDKLAKLQQGSDTMEEFVRKFRKLAVNLRDYRREDELLDEFIRKTSNIHVRSAVRASRPRTLEEAMKSALDVESDLRSDGSLSQGRRMERRSDRYNERRQYTQQPSEHRYRQPSSRDWQPRPVRDRDGKIRCFNCGSESHLARACTKQRQQDQQQSRRRQEPSRRFSKMARRKEASDIDDDQPNDSSDDSGKGEDL